MVTVWKIGIFLVLLNVQMSYTQNIFLTDCNAPLVVGHINRFGHTYCSHACNSRAAGVCSANGDCTCPCSTTPPMPGQSEFDQNICPQRNDPPDPDPTHLATCRARCLASCNTPGADGIICGEIGPLPTPDQNTFFKLCVCTCPICPIPTTTTTIATTTITPTTSVTTNPAITLIILQKLLFYYLFLFLSFKKFILLTLKCFWITKALLFG